MFKCIKISTSRSITLAKTSTTIMVCGTGRGLPVFTAFVGVGRLKICCELLLINLMGNSVQL